MKFGVKILLGLIVVIGLFLLTAPASLMTSVLPEQNSPVSLSGLQGKVLEGEAGQVNVRGIPLQNVSWDLNFLSTITGSPSAAIEINDPALTATTNVTFSSPENWALEALNGDIQLNKLDQFIPALRPLGITGKATASNIFVALSETAFQAGEGTIEWDNARFNFYKQTLDLESISAELGLAGSDLTLDYRGSSALAPNGRITLTPKGDYQMTIYITPSALPQTMQWVSRMGKVAADGTVLFELNGRLR